MKIFRAVFFGLVLYNVFFSVLYNVFTHHPDMGMRDDTVLFKIGNLKLTATNCIRIAGHKGPSHKMVEIHFSSMKSNAWGKINYVYSSNPVIYIQWWHLYRKHQLNAQYRPKKQAKHRQ